MLVLSLFPGIGMLDMAFEQEGFCVVRGPDLLWGGDIRTFHPTSGKFDGIIGGPPCQAFSTLQALQRARGYAPKHGNMIPEFERCVLEAKPDWFLMENVTAAPAPRVNGYSLQCEFVRDVWVGGETSRLRKFSFGSRAGWRLGIDVLALHRTDPALAVTSSDGGKSVRMARYTVAEALKLSGLPADFFKDSPFTVDGQKKMIGNGVPLAMGRALAQAVKRAVGLVEIAA